MFGSLPPAMISQLIYNERARKSIARTELASRSLAKNPCVTLLIANSRPTIGNHDDSTQTYFHRDQD